MSIVAVAEGIEEIEVSVEGGDDVDTVMGAIHDALSLPHEIMHYDYSFTDAWGAEQMLGGVAAGTPAAELGLVGCGERVTVAFGRRAHARAQILAEAEAACGMYGAARPIVVEREALAAIEARDGPRMRMFALAELPERDYVETIAKGLIGASATLSLLHLRTDLARAA
eukprot:TRINITY_DN5243_c0_g3_i1.p1 TRINITY_DN5243_c0_g3~~TRINITY_DN5243_c0_g3_i1.p1  ORF type:complete len:169 (+),score=49.10 TRINITY_DN5243_c0_g3_i1:51-557(+)